MKRVWVVVVLAVILGLLAWWPRHRPPLEPPKNSEVLAFVETPESDGPAATTSKPEVHEALLGVDPAVLVTALRKAKVRGVWVPPRLGNPVSPDSRLHQRLSAGWNVEGLRGEDLRPDGLVYVVRDLSVPEDLAERVLARAARAILAGAEPPSEEVFPEALSSTQPVEVLVALRQGGTLRLWRSARARSISAGLALAAVAARDRWTERSDTMGGPLSDVLPRLDVEVWLLLEDGSFQASAEPLLDQLITRAHGVAFEQPTRWRYFLPGEVRRLGSGRAAFEALFKQNDLPPDQLFRSDRRLYRFVTRTVSVDPAGSESD